jgi:hypothetical protein
MNELTTKNSMTKNAILASRATHNVPESVLWGIQLVTKQAEALRAMPKDDMKARKAAMKAVRASLSI